MLESDSDTYPGVFYYNDEGEHELECSPREELGKCKRRGGVCVALTTAGELRGGECFRKRAGAFVYLVISTSSARFLRLDPEMVHAVSSNGNTASVKKDKVIVRASFEEMGE